MNIPPTPSGFTFSVADPLALDSITPDPLTPSRTRPIGETSPEEITVNGTPSLVDEILTRLRRIDLIAWAQIAAWAEQIELSFADLRLLLALRIEHGPSSISHLAGMSGLPLDTAYPAVHGLRSRGYLREERREYSLSQGGQELVATLDGAHREGVQAYVDQLDTEERRRLETAFGIADP